MGKRSKNSEERRKKFKSDADSLLSGFGNVEDVDELGEDWDNEEQSYELKPRNVDDQVIESLPIKIGNKIERQQREVTKEKEEEPQPEAKEENEAEKKIAKEEDEADKFDDTLNPKERLVKMKEEIANLASKLMEDPEENINCLTRLRKMSMSRNFVLSQLSIISLIPVFKNLSPSYKIRALTDAEKRTKVSKEVAKLRIFEQSLIYNYKIFIDHLGKLSKVTRSNSENNKKITNEQVKLGEISIKSCCDLMLSSLRFFNCRNDLLTIIIKRLNKKPKDIKDFEIFIKCIRVLETLLTEDKEHGEISNDLVMILCKVIKDKKFRVDESVLNVFLSLSLLDDYNPNDETRPKEKLKKKDRVHLSKKQRKARKELKEIEEEMEKAKQSITAEEREKFQSNVLKTLLKLYLETLKAGSESINTGEKNDASMLLASVLEGLSKFGRMANFDLLGDFLEILREIMGDIIDNHSLNNEEIDDEIYEGGLYDSKQLRMILLCIVTSFQLILNHSTMGRLPISIDLSKFISSLYLVLSDLSLDSDLEFSHKTLRLLDPLSQDNYLEKPSVNVSTKAELLLNCLDSIFFKSRNGSNSRAIAFIKRLYILMLQTPEKTSLATLKFIGKLVNKYGESTKGLWNSEERINGEGNYSLGIEYIKDVELERSNADASTLWENVLLDKHYNPMVRDNSRSLMKLSKDRK
ncbi:nucleolar complex-associated protein 3 [[Candida] jaroonii]|uniref:Nucleolar complex-associated protein 3 n=1 Tax=[Candida] jaroonii TaxID=467808 RepID=A0ACA9Y854_9ASCO|nr:nucleolar complex-associated protein 3 [[Candida] jaroonii]